MGLAAHNIGKYKLGRTIGEGTFAKVKLGVDSTNGQYVAIKIIDKHMVLESNLKYQVNFQTSLLKVQSFLLSNTMFEIPVSGAKRNKNNEASASPQHRTNT